MVLLFPVVQTNTTNEFFFFSFSFFFFFSFFSFLGYDNLSGASRMNKAVVVFFQEETFVSQLIEPGLGINESHHWLFLHPPADLAEATNPAVDSGSGG